MEVKISPERIKAFSDMAVADSWPIDLVDQDTGEVYQSARTNPLRDKLETARVEDERHIAPVNQNAVLNIPEILSLLKVDRDEFKPDVLVLALEMVSNQYFRQRYNALHPLSLDEQVALHALIPDIVSGLVDDAQFVNEAGTYYHQAQTHTSQRLKI